MPQHANQTSFAKGQIPWNKGLKGIHLSVKTEFKKGEPSIKSVPVGTRKIRIHKRDGRRRFIKIGEPSRWIEYAKHLWIRMGGEIPSGMVTHHKDKNRLNDSIDNICILTRAEHINAHRKELREAYKAKRSAQLREISAGED